MKNIYIILSLLLLVAIPAGTSYAQEMVLNGDLEEWDDLFTPTSWEKYENISQAKPGLPPGSFGAAHKSASSSKDLQQNITGIVAGTNYTISYWYYDNDTSAKTRMWSYWLDGTSTLDDHQAELRWDDYSTNDPDWQHYEVALTAPANADGFRLEVRVYHENNNVDGVVFYDDFSIQAAGVSPEPTNYPTDFAAASAGVAINLSWTDAIGDQLPNAYLVLASTEDNITAPADGSPVADDTDLSDGSGALNIGYGVEACTFSDLETNTPYYFKIYPYTNGGADIDFKNDGTAPAASATTADISIIESQDFEDGWGNWLRISIVGDQEWEIDDEHGNFGPACAKCTGYDGQAYANEDWLISPPMNFNNYQNEMINFWNADAYDGPAMEALISNDFDGSDPTTATWQTLTFETSTGYFEWISSGDINISGIDGENVYIAFKFTSTDQESATWEVDDVLITGTGASAVAEQNTFTSELSIFPNPAMNRVNIVCSDEHEVSVQVYTLLGEKVSEKVSFARTMSIELNNMVSGIFILQFTDQYGNTRNEKLIIEK